MADFEWSWPKKIERDVIERAFSLDFIKEARNLVMIGQNGLGKSMIAKNICHTAILSGYSVLFRTASDLIEDLQCESATARRRKLRTYGNAGLVCIDEVGYLSYDDNAADLLYEIVNRRYERRSLIVTTNKGFKQWNEVFPNASCIVTLVDRLTHHADVTMIEGDSYRLRESELEAAHTKEEEMISKNPAEDLSEYAEVILKLYLKLPETPLKSSVNDRQMAESLYVRRIDLKAVESALLLGTIRRLSRSPDMPPLTPIRSLAYFLPVIEEILFNPVPDDYLHYLRIKVGLLSGRGKTIKRR